MSKAKNDIINEIIRQITVQNSGLTESDILELMEKKKSEVGAGYLTDLGAIYLVLNDLGIKIEPRKSITIGELTPGIRGMDVECYFLSSIKLSGRTVFYVFDKNNVIRGIQWGDKDVFEGFALGQGITIKKAIVKQAQDGSVEIHMNDQSELIKRQDSIKIDDACTDVRPSGLGIYKGVVEGPIRDLTFKRKDGSNGRGTSFFLKIGEQKLRTVIWSQIDLNLYEGHELIIGPLNVKKNNYGTELSGDESTTIIKVGPKFTLIEGDGKHFIAVNGSGKPVELEFDAPPNGKVVIAKKFQIKYPIFKVLDYDLIDEPGVAPKVVKIAESGQDMVNIEFIVLSDPVLVNNAYEIFIGDDSGEGKIVACRELYSKVSKLLVGQRVSALGVLGDGQRNFRIVSYTAIKVIK